MLPPSGSTDPSTVDVEIAVAVTPFGATRWSRLTVSGASSVMWLVPARPGAALDWASEAWMNALQAASTTRVVPPTDAPPCDMPSAPQPTAPWGAAGTRTFPRAVTVLASEADVRERTSARGFEVPAATAAKIADAYAAGNVLVSVELDASSGTISSPTLRVSDDGAPLLPLALTGTRQTSVRVTALVLNEAGAALPGARALDADSITWGARGGSFASARAATIAGRGDLWVRESASHDVLFDGVPVPRATPIEPVLTGYFREANGQPRFDCEKLARAATSSAGVVGRACATAALARVPGGTACAAQAGAIDPGAFACGPGIDDLAIALSGTAPSKATLTRFTGLVAQGTLGADLPISALATAQSPVLVASRYEPCPAVGSPSGPAAASASSSSTALPRPRPFHYHTDNGCSGSTTTLIYEDNGEEDVVAEDEGCDAKTSPPAQDPTPTSTGESGGSGGSDTTGSSSSSSSSSSSGASGWDQKDDTSSSDSCGSGKSSDSSSDSCGSSSSSSSSSSDSCGSSSSSSSSSDSCSSSSSSSSSDSCSCGSSSGSSSSCSTAGRASGGAKAKRRRPSSMSRAALFLVALVLPLRRRFRRMDATQTQKLRSIC